jgi:hypothetical protein
LIDQNAKFTNNTIEVDMSSGPEYDNMHLTVTEFEPKNEDFLAFNLVGPKDDTNNHSQRFIPSYAPPFGLHRASTKELKSKCLDHIKSIIQKERDIGEATRGDISIISWKVYEAINNYRKSNGRNSDVSNSFSTHHKLN